MAGRRVPLGNLPNAANSPFREPAAPGTKRPRAHAADVRDLAYGQQPPAKKHIVETDDTEIRRRAMRQPTTQLRKTENARDGRSAAKVADRKATKENLEDIAQWQRHYKKLFPTFTFYYDNVPDELRYKISRQIVLLGAREEVFFSKTVTHVITTRVIPDGDTTSSSSTGRSPPKLRHEVLNGTVNPVHLRKGATTFHPNDILIRARDMGIKTWPLEKIQRMLTTMFNSETGEAPVQSYRATATAPTKANQQEMLSQMLAKEKEYNHANMEWATDMAAFRGYYVYVHDMDEVTKPVIVRDYSKPATKEQGKWPQLRVTAPGRCPFLDDPSSKYERAPAPEKAPRTRAAAAREKPVERPALAENNNLARRQRAVSAQAEEAVKPLGPPKTIPAKRTNSTDNLPLFGSAQASLRQHPRFAGGEPVASGVQPSNITSAIRSQMISSTAAAPGGKAGATKELHRLQRQVLERNNVTNPYLNNDLRAAINTGARGAQKRKAAELAHIKEEDAEEEERPKPAPRKKKVVEKELKPGYCENCRIKFGDFDEHVLSRLHRKFATTNENWAELDSLLDQLVRPGRDDFDELAF